MSRAFWMFVGAVFAMIGVFIAKHSGSTTDAAKGSPAEFVAGSSPIHDPSVSMSDVRVPVPMPGDVVPNDLRNLRQEVLGLQNENEQLRLEILKLKADRTFPEEMAQAEVMRNPEFQELLNQTTRSIVLNLTKKFDLRFANGDVRWLADRIEKDDWDNWGGSPEEVVSVYFRVPNK